MSANTERVRRSTRLRRKDGSATHVRLRKPHPTPSSGWEDDPGEVQLVSTTRIQIEEDVPVIHPVVHIVLAVGIGGFLFWWYRPAMGPLMSWAAQQLPSSDTLLSARDYAASVLVLLVDGTSGTLARLAWATTWAAHYLWRETTEWAREAGTRLTGLTAYFPTQLWRWVWIGIVLGCKIGIQIAFAFLAVVWLVYVAEIVLPMTLRRL